MVRHEINTSKMGLEISSVSHSYNDELVLDDINLSFDPGTLIALLGPSGCGKTTLLKICAGLISPKSGHVSINGIDPIVARKKGLIGFAFQLPVLLPWRSALDNVLLPLEVLNGKSTPNDVEVAKRLLSIVDLDGKINTKPEELSGGMRQRVGLARALVTKPYGLFLDEPFSALDGETRISLNEKVRELWLEIKNNLLFVTHSPEEAVLVADFIIILSAQPARVIKVVPSNLGEKRTESLRYKGEYHDVLNEVRNIGKNYGKAG